MTPEDFLGRTIRAAAGAWFIFANERSASPNPIWLEVEGLGQVRCGCAGSGTVSLTISTPAGFDMAEAGRVEVAHWRDPALTPIVGHPVERVVALVYEPHQAEVGFVLETSHGAIAIANLGDELHVGPWPDSRWEAEAVDTRS